MAAPGKRGEVPVEWENRMEWENYGGESEEAEITNAEAGEGEEEEGKPVAGAKKDFWSATDKTEEGREEEREKDKKLPATEQDPQQTPPSLSQSPAEDPGMYTSDNAEGKEKDEWEDAPQEPPQKKEEREKEQQLATEQQTLPSSYSQPQTQELCPRDEDEWGDAHQKPSGNSSSESSDEDRGCGRWWSSRGQVWHTLLSVELLTLESPIYTMCDTILSALCTLHSVLCTLCVCVCMLRVGSCSSPESPRSGAPETLPDTAMDTRSAPTRQSCDSHVTVM